jgi:hypothetical protein
MNVGELQEGKYYKINKKTLAVAVPMYIKILLKFEKSYWIKFDRATSFGRCDCTEFPCKIDKFCRFNNEVPGENDRHCCAFFDDFEPYCTEVSRLEGLIYCGE